MPKTTKNIKYLSFDVFTDSDSSRLDEYIRDVNNHLPKDIRIAHRSTSKSDKELDLPVVCYPDRDCILDHISLVMRKIKEAKESNKILKEGLERSIKVCVRNNTQSKSFHSSLAASVLGHKNIRNLCENLGKFVGLSLSTDAKKALASFEFDQFMNSLEKSNWKGPYQRLVKKAFGLFIYEDQLFFVDPAYKFNPSFLKVYLTELPDDILETLLEKWQMRSNAKQKLTENVQGPTNPLVCATSEQVTDPSQEHIPSRDFSFDCLKHADGKFYYDSNCMIALTIQDVQKSMRILTEFANISIEDYKKLFERKTASGSLYRYDTFFSGYQCPININVLMRLIVCKKKIDILHFEFFEQLTVHHPYIFKEYADWVAKGTPMMVCVDSSIYYEEVRATFKERFFNTTVLLTLPDIMKNKKYHLFTVDAYGKKTGGQICELYDLGDGDFILNHDELLDLNLPPFSDEGEPLSEKASVSLQVGEASDSQAKEVPIATDEEIAQWQFEIGSYELLRIENQFKILAVFKNTGLSSKGGDNFLYETFTNKYGERILNYILKKHDITLDLSDPVPDPVPVSDRLKRSERPLPEKSDRRLRSHKYIFDPNDPFFQCVLDQENLAKISHDKFCELASTELTKTDFEEVRNRLIKILQSFPTDTDQHSSVKKLQDYDSVMLSDFDAATETSLLNKDSSGKDQESKQDGSDTHDTGEHPPCDPEHSSEQEIEKTEPMEKRLKTTDKSSGTVGTAVVVSDNTSESIFRGWDALCIQTQRGWDALRIQTQNAMDEKDRIIQELRRQLTDQVQLDDLRGQLTSANDKNQQLETEKTQLKQEHARGIEELKQTHARGIEELKQTHAREIEELKQTHAREIEKLTSKHALENKQFAEISDITAELARLRKDKEVLFFKKDAYDNWKLQQELNFESEKQREVEAAKAQVSKEKDEANAKLTQECQDLKEKNKRLQQLLDKSGKFLADYTAELKKRQPPNVSVTPVTADWLRQNASSGSSSASDTAAVNSRSTDRAASGSGGSKFQNSDGAASGSG